MQPIRMRDFHEGLMYNRAKRAHRQTWVLVILSLPILYDVENFTCMFVFQDGFFFWGGNEKMGLNDLRVSFHYSLAFWSNQKLSSFQLQNSTTVQDILQQEKQSGDLLGVSEINTDQADSSPYTPTPVTSQLSINLSIKPT